MSAASRGSLLFASKARIAGGIHFCVSANPCEKDLFRNGNRSSPSAMAANAIIMKSKVLELLTRIKVMKAEDYFHVFEGEIDAEIRRLVDNSRIERYMNLDRTIRGYSSRRASAFGRTEYLDAQRAFYKLSLETGIANLSNTISPTIREVGEEVSSRIEGDNVVDIGCCDGFYTIYYAMMHPDVKFTGIDLSPDALEYAAGQSQSRGLTNTRWVCGDILDSATIRNVEDADTVIVQETLFYLFGTDCRDRERRFLDALSAHQKKGSVVIIGQMGSDMPMRFSDEECDYELENYTVIPFERLQGLYEIGIFRKLE